MGLIKGPYKAEFPEGTVVQIVGRPELEGFKRSWRLHHPLSEDQLAYAGLRGRIARVGFYFGGDELYNLEGVPGIWHEACLQSALP